MDFLNGKIKTLYFKYLAAAFGSALITSIYSIVDMAMVGQYHGPEGAAALAVVAPVWNIIYSMGLLMGIGGSVLFSTIRGREGSEIRRSNEYFTISVIGSVILALAAWAAIIFLDRELLLLFGAGKGSRIRETLKYALGTTTFFSIVWVVLCMVIPNQFIRIFMDPTEAVLQIAPSIIQSYGISFLLLPLNIFSTYYFQAVMKPQAAFVVSVSRGLVISGILILLLPALVGADALWFAMPITELFTAVYAVVMMRNYTRKLAG